MTKIYDKELKKFRSLREGEDPSITWAEAMSRGGRKY